MVVSAEEVLNKITREGRQQISKLEKEIDHILKSEFNSGRDYVCYTISKDITPKSIELIKAMYQKAGWKVTYESDQRDGDYLRFELTKRYGEN